MNDIADAYDWNRWGVLYTIEDITKNTALAVGRELERNGKTVIYQVFPSLSHDSRQSSEDQLSQKEVLRSFKDRVRIFFYTCYPSDCLNLMESAKAVGMMNGEYVFIGHRDLITFGHPSFDGTMIINIRNPSSQYYIYSMVLYYVVLY